MKLRNHLTACWLILLTVLMTRSSSLVLGQTESASPSASPTAETTQNLRSRIDRVLNETDTGVLGQNTNSPSAFFGQISRLTEQSVTLTTTNGLRLVPLDKNVVIELDGSEITLSELDQVEVDDWAKVYGLGTADAFQPRFVEFSDTSPLIHAYQATIGTLTEVTATNLTIESRLDQSEQSFEIASEVTVTDLLGETVDATQLESLQQALVVYQDREDSNVVTAIRLLTATAVPTDE